MQRNKYVIVRRRGIQFLDVCDWVYWCSCDDKMSSLKSINSTVDIKMEGIVYTFTLIHSQTFNVLHKERAVIWG